MKVLSLDVAGEVWKPIPGFAGYEVSNLGRVRSHWWYAHGVKRGDRELRDAGWLMRQQTTHHGHMRVMVGRGAKRSQQFVHRLVLMAFVGSCPEGLCACHWNGIADDNRLTNLRWDTVSANQKDSVRHGTNNPNRGSVQKHSILTEDIVRRIRETVGEKPTNVWAREVGCSRALIYRVRTRKTWAWVA